MIQCLENATIILCAEGQMHAGLALHLVTEDANGLRRHVRLIKGGEVIHGHAQHPDGYRLPFPHELSR